MTIALDTLKSERDALKQTLRSIESEQRKIESDLKVVRQKELRTKREIEALSTLIDIAESREQARQAPDPDQPDAVAPRPEDN